MGLLAAMALAAVGGMFLVVVIARSSLDQAALERERLMVEEALHHGQTDLAALVELAAKSVESRGHSLKSVSASDLPATPLVAAMDESGTFSFIRKNGGAIPMDMEKSLQSTFDPLMRELIISQYAGTSRGTGRLVASGISMIEGKPYFMAAVTLHVEQSGPVHAVLAAARPIDASWIKHTSEHLVLNGLNLVQNVPPRTRAVLPLSQLRQGLEGYLVWTPRAPGDAFTQRIAIPGGLLVLFLLGLTATFARTGYKAAVSLIASEGRAWRMAFEDGLTGLPNRTALLQALGAKDAPDAVFLLDIDRFKEINDTLGHPVGDMLIVEVGLRLRQLMGRDDIVARLGGDEFAIVVRSGWPIPATIALASRIVQKMAEPFILAGTEHHLSASVGVCLRMEEGETAQPQQEYLRRADVALYRAKELGRGCHVVFNGEFDVEALRRKQLETDLRQALANDGLHLAFQPQFNTQTMRLEGVEALVRWQHARLGMISPAMFIPIAEETGMIRELGRIVLEKAMSHAQDWKSISVAVNVSTVQLRDPGFVPMLRSLLARYRVPAEQIELEITESILLDESPEITERLHAIKSLGFRIALDDFGTGFSSLRYLARFNFDKIKIDRHFIVDANSTMRAMGLLRSVASIGHMTGLKICAEGVETREQFAMVSEIGCNEVQGYYFMKPQAPEQIDDLLGRVHTIDERLTA